MRVMSQEYITPLELIALLKLQKREGKLNLTHNFLHKVIKNFFHWAWERTRPENDGPGGTTDKETS